MPSTKYYRSILPLDLLQIVGNLAGDELYKLVFTFTPKRQFLGNIEMHWRDKTLYCVHKHNTSVLKAEYWQPVRIDCIGDVLVMLSEKCNLPSNVMIPSLNRITDILLEVHDYKLRRGRRKVWVTQ